MFVFVENTAAKAKGKVDVFLESLKKIYDWLTTFDQTLVPNLKADCYKKLKLYIKDLITYRYKQLREEASNENLTFEDIADRDMELRSLPYVGPLICDAMDGQSQNAQCTESDEVIIQLILAGTLNENNDQIIPHVEDENNRTCECLSAVSDPENLSSCQWIAHSLRTNKLLGIGFVCVIIILVVWLQSLDYREMWTLALLAFVTLVVICFVPICCNAKDWWIQLKSGIHSIAMFFQKMGIYLNTIMSNFAVVSSTLPGTEKKLEEAIVETSGNFNLVLGTLSNTFEIFGETAERAENNMHWQAGRFLNGIGSSSDNLSNTLQESTSKFLDGIGSSADNLSNNLQENTNIARKEFLVEAQSLRESMSSGIKDGHFKPAAKVCIFNPLQYESVICSRDAMDEVLSDLRKKIASNNGSSFNFPNGFPISAAAHERFRFSSSPVRAQLNSTLRSDSDQSLGFGFVAFRSLEELDAALAVQAHVIDDTEVELNYRANTFIVAVTRLHPNISGEALSDFFSRYGELFTL
ncbi:hypothetical protein DdX_17402 [Ditylenchus destructor]|uniref:RRM domain-containing protein n=1 Tax=Ditylenchus destructor TaxID=166010 RepID=A0AAD4MMG5_9BILA|nr:hypothetical protein DdX_17402 [Ditylenchus destructor]